MVTNQLMVRKMGDFDVIQRTEDGYFDANKLLVQWNSIDWNPKRQMSRFLESPKTKEFIEALKCDESQIAKMQHANNQPFTIIKGKNTKNGKTVDKVWMNPLLFIKFSMWINPSFEVKVLHFVYDNMIEYRNMAGDSYQKLAKAVLSICGNRNSYKYMKKVAEALNYIVFNENKKMIRNEHGDEKKQRELYDLEDRIAMLIGDGFIHNYNEIIAYMRKLWQRKYQPKVLK